MKHLSSQKMLRLGSQRSKPDRKDTALQMAQLRSHSLHGGSLLLNDTSQADTNVATAPSRRRTSFKARPNKRTRFSFVASSQPEPAYFQASPLSLFSLSPVTSCSSFDILDTYPLDPDDELDEYLWSIFAESFGRSSFLINNLDVVDGASTRSTALRVADSSAGDSSIEAFPSAKKKHKNGGKNPKVSLGTYFEQHDGNLICLCGRGAHNKHPGNKNYRDFIHSWLQNYQSRTKEGKEGLTNSAVKEFERQGRRLFKLNCKDEWEELDQESARKKIRPKISQRFRDS